MANKDDLFKKIIAHSKEYGFIFQSSEIYDGLSAVYDYAQNGVELKNNIKSYWWKSMVQMNENIVGIDSAIFMHPTVWKASGHVGAFNDPMIDNKDSKKVFQSLLPHFNRIAYLVTSKLFTCFNNLFAFLLLTKYFLTGSKILFIYSATAIFKSNGCSCLFL